MKFTRAEVEKITSEQPSYQPIQIDGIPEGFSFILESKVSIGGIHKFGTLVAFVPLGERDDPKNMITYPVVSASDDEALVDKELAEGKRVLLERFNKITNGK